MESERFKKALGRLEAAIDRLEAVGHGPASGGHGGGQADAQADARLAALEERHRKLRAGTGEALARLDRLIETAGTPAADS